LEFPVVFLVNLVAARFPTRERREQIPIPEELIKEILPVGDYHEEEERRLFYVGMTRARDRLFLTAADYYGEGKREKKLSPFVIEALGEEVVNSIQYTADSGQLSLLEWSKTEIKEETVSWKLQPVNYLSFSQIDTFNTCPRQYRFRYLQRIPVPPSAAQSFGNSMHQTLRDFYQEIKDGQKMTKNDLLKLLEINWSPQGYSSKSHEERMKKQGERILADFYEKFDGKQIPRDLEQPFIIKISPQLKIGGKIDRVDEEKEKLEIIDYKTGKMMEQKEIDKSLQMTVYALAAADQGIYGKKPEEIVLTFYYLDTGERKSTKRTVSQLEQARKELIEKAKEIGESDFAPTPNRMCEFCDFKLLCEAWS
jgi:DNA helicase-2/ATP-dependent DNA helicase PcrA